MRSVEPPKVARWMLSHFGCSPNNATVIGDLDERYRIGHSAAWYWRQVATAIVVGFFKEISSHKVRALIAVLTGWVVLLSASYFLNYFVQVSWSLPKVPTVWMYPDALATFLTWTTFAATAGLLPLLSVLI